MTSTSSALLTCASDNECCAAPNVGRVQCACVEVAARPTCAAQCSAALVFISLQWPAGSCGVASYPQLTRGSRDLRDARRPPGPLRRAQKRGRAQFCARSGRRTEPIVLCSAVCRTPAHSRMQWSGCFRPRRSASLGRGAPTFAIQSFFHFPLFILVF